MRNLGFEINIKNLFFGNAFFENEKNSKMFLIIQKYLYILSPSRFI
jgi:hypothetical protein